MLMCLFTNEDSVTQISVENMFDQENNKLIRQLDFNQFEASMYLYGL